MKLSQMTTDQAADVLVRISEPVGAILDDDRTKDVFVTLAGMGSDTPVIRMVSTLVTKGLPLLLKYRAQETYEIISAMTGKDVKDVEKQNFLVTLSDCKDFMDKDFLDFFHFSAGAGSGKGKK